MIRPFIAAATAFGLVLAAQGAGATTVAVQHADLDLSTQQGQQELDKRIDRAARKVCRAPATTGTLVGRVDPDCYLAAVNSVRHNVSLAQRSATPSH